MKTGDILVEMVAAAFQTVTFFKLTLGPADQLERVCRDLEGRWGLPPNSSREDIRSAVAKNPEVLRELQKVGIYVPALFLAPWFQSEMRGISAGTDRVKSAIELSLLFRDEKEAPPYWLEARGGEQVVCFAPEWIHYLHSNVGVLESFVRPLCADFSKLKTREFQPSPKN